jgi:hypothetical protein
MDFEELKDRRRNAAYVKRKRKTSRQAIRNRQRQVEVLKLFADDHVDPREIARQKHISTATVYRDINAATQELSLVPFAESLKLHLAEVHAMMAVVAPQAKKLPPDYAAMKELRELIELESRLCGNWHHNRGGGVNVNINNNNEAADARTTGIQVTMVNFKAPRDPEPVPRQIELDAMRLIEPPTAPPPDKPPHHLTSSTAPHPQSVPVVPPSALPDQVATKVAPPERSRNPFLRHDERAVAEQWVMPNPSGSPWDRRR